MCEQEINVLLDDLEKLTDTPKTGSPEWSPNLNPNPNPDPDPNPDPNLQNDAQDRVYSAETIC